MKLAIATVNAEAVAFGARCNGGALRVYDAIEMPATPEDTPTGTLMFEVTLENPAFGSATNGQVTAIPPFFPGTTIAGTPFYGRLVTSTGDPIADLAYGTDFTMSKTPTLLNDDVYVVLLRYTRPTA